ncbi:MAG: 50S ribosomal protein L6 [Candidatus Anammoxibacter sp.]
MSRIARKPIKIPDTVKVTLINGSVNVKGPKGELVQKLHPAVEIELDDKEGLLKVLCNSPKKNEKGMQGLFYSLILNMVNGVVNQFSKGIEIIGLGYTVKSQGKKLTLQIGFNKPVNMDIPDGIEIDIISQTNPGKLNIKGADKQLVGQFAANLRHIRPPEPYKGKGIKYVDEIIRRKAGKALASTGS